MTGFVYDFYKRKLEHCVPKTKKSCYVIHPYICKRDFFPINENGLGIPKQMPNRFGRF